MTLGHHSPPDKCTSYAKNFHQVNSKAQKQAQYG